MGKSRTVIKERKPVYSDDDKFMKTKIKIYADNMTTNFHNKKMTKQKGPCKCLSVINNARFCY